MIKRYAAEFIGTFFIVFAPVALSATGKLPGGESSLLGAALLSGLVVLAMIYALGPISAAHFNPAVTLGFAAAKRFPWKFVLPYWLSQFGGGIAAAALAATLYGSGHGAHVPTGPVAQCFGTEVMLGFMLMFVIIAVATDKRTNATVPGLAIGLTVVVGVLIGGPLTGGSMNPARSFGPALFAQGPALANVWLYLTAPAVGAVMAALLYEAIRLHQDEAVGAPNELLEALESVSRS